MNEETHPDVATSAVANMFGVVQSTMRTRLERPRAAGPAQSASSAGRGRHTLTLDSDMKHCTTCGGNIQRGSTGGRLHNESRCVICQTAALFAHWRYPAPKSGAQQGEAKGGDASQ